HEIRFRQEQSVTTGEVLAEEGEEGEVSHVITASAIEEILPSLDPLERQILLLRLHFTLSAFAIAQVVSKPEISVSESLVALHGKFSNRLVTRKLGKTKETDGARGTLRPTIGQYGPIKEERDTSADPIYGLTQKERQILYLAAQGLTNEKIAKIQVVSAETVKSHVQHILAKMDASSRAQAVSLAHESGLLGRVAQN
ncbi:MAG: helix-turn-helix transcriptional regulator, partial [Patescibacteria group bacterium]